MLDASFFFVFTYVWLQDPCLWNIGLAVLSQYLCRGVQSLRRPHLHTTFRHGLAAVKNCASWAQVRREQIIQQFGPIAMLTHPDRWRKRKEKLQEPPARLEKTERGSWVNINMRTPVAVETT
ncbi:uncharacterized protein CLUP02_09968 [Colletotrichum lupini]|uniref:Uncharacterized protein n=1 Tax=Colletotrichum lupini TaxID=145971 RepID=A0A9Q8WIF8_9PEZI|nr:uncharacterized protein CLUP02_09968 [Colletotrichum lupini]UQC84471.1 hypothetical protein CLUP02_09968 [Colletotrichum lupini]